MPATMSVTIDAPSAPDTCTRSLSSIVAVAAPSW
jgi:hypothetical protein